MGQLGRVMRAPTFTITRNFPAEVELSDVIRAAPGAIRKPIKASGTTLA